MPETLKRVGLTLLLAAGLAVLPLEAQQPQGRQFVFRGRVEKVDATTGALSVYNENIDGWMAPMSMMYRAEPPEVLKQLKAGDVIIATVYENNFSTLFNVRVDAAATAAAASRELPPVSYICPTPAEAAFIDDKPGTCPKSGAALLPARIVIAYSCLKSLAFILENPGRCPTDRTELVPIVASMYFTCSRFPGVREMDPGTCPDGSARVKAFDRRPHGDHNARHGGAVYMSENQWVHLEGTFVEPNVFRVYLYDEMARPMTATEMVGRVVMADATGGEVGAPIPLVQGTRPDRSSMEVKLPPTKFPFNMRLYMKFTPAEREQVFDFTFKEYSKEP